MIEKQVDGDKVVVIGIWHLGSVTSACLADLGYRVVGFDPEPERVDTLNRGVPPLFEPGLEELFRKNLSTGTLSFTSDLKTALLGSKYVVVAFDTPVDDRDEADLSSLYDAILQSIPYLESDCTIVVSSQVPVGTCEDFAAMIREKRPSLRFDIAYVPENLRLGQAIERFERPDMIVIGSNNSRTHKKVELFYSVIEAPKVKVDLRTAEMIKHAINSYLAMQVSFINEIANLCERLGADAVIVGEAMRLDSRIGSKAMLKPGLGFAGGTLARDLKTLQKLGQRVGYEMLLVNGILAVNRNQNKTIVERLRKLYGSINDLTVGVLGLTYKPGTSTLRRSASLEIIHDLVKEGAKVRAYDSKADIHEIHGPIEFENCPDPATTAENADALILVTAWPEFKNLDFSRIKSLMRRPVIIDAQNTLDAERLVHMGFTYLGVGRTLRVEIGAEGK